MAAIFRLFALTVARASRWWYTLFRSINRRESRALDPSGFMRSEYPGDTNDGRGDDVLTIPSPRRRSENLRKVADPEFDRERVESVKVESAIFVTQRREINIPSCCCDYANPPRFFSIPPLKDRSAGSPSISSVIPPGG